MKITETTTLGDLELHLRSFGLHLHCEMTLDDGRIFAHVRTEGGVRAEAYGSTLAEAINSAIDRYMVNVFGPPARQVIP